MCIYCTTHPVVVVCVANINLSLCLACVVLYCAACRVILCKGLDYPPTYPRPVMSTLPLQLPLCEPQTEKTELEVWKKACLLCLTFSLPFLPLSLPPGSVPTASPSQGSVCTANRQHSDQVPRPTLCSESISSHGRPCMCVSSVQGFFFRKYHEGRVDTGK